MPAPRFFPALEGLRGLAAVSVVVFHVGLFTATGTHGVSLAVHKVTWYLGSGVILFFALSGLLLYRPFAAALITGDAPPGWRAFFRRRSFRIIPTYWLVLGVAMIAGVTILSSGPSSVTIGHPHSVGIALSWITLTHMLVPHDAGTGILPAWTLTLEVIFYLSLPLLVFAARKAVRNPGLSAAVTPVIALLILSLAGNLLLGALGGPDSTPTWRAVLTTSFPVFADLFAFGMAVAVWIEHRGEDWRPSPRSRLALITLSIACMTIFVIDDGGPASTRFVTVLAGLAAAGLLLYCASADDDVWYSRLLRSPVALTAGALSYPMYLIHDPVIKACDSIGLVTGSAASLLECALVIGTVTVASSFAVHRYVEVPFMRLGRTHTLELEIDPTAPASTGPEGPASSGRTTRPA